MINVTTPAQEYFAHLLAQQDEPGMGLRLSVVAPGTPNASCDLQFCPAGSQRENDRVFDYGDFSLYVAADSESWLEQAEIDFDSDATGGQLSIKAPGIRGHEPAADAPIEERIEWLLESEINPMLASHGGRVALVSVTEQRQAVLRFGGGCQGCGMADVTLKQGIERNLLDKIPQLTGVLDATDHERGDNPYYRGNAEGESAFD